MPVPHLANLSDNEIMEAVPCLPAVPVRLGVLIGNNHTK